MEWRCFPGIQIISVRVKNRRLAKLVYPQRLWTLISQKLLVQSTWNFACYSQYSVAQSVKLSSKSEVVCMEASVELTWMTMMQYSEKAHWNSQSSGGSDSHLFFSVLSHSYLNLWQIESASDSRCGFRSPEKRESPRFQRAVTSETLWYQT